MIRVWIENSCVQLPMRMHLSEASIMEVGELVYLGARLFHNPEDDPKRTFIEMLRSKLKN